jgi:protein-tyrosine sulfotransferase
MKAKEYFKKILIGRDFQLIDKTIFYLSNKKNSGWVVGNKIRNFFYGKVKEKSNEDLIIIGCYPRSGSTLLKNLLNQHPKIIAGEIEINIFQDIKTKDKLINAFNINQKEISQAKNNANDLVSFSENILEKVKEKNEGEKVLIKQPKHVLFIDKIFKHYPQSKFIHIIRDGRDATMSQRYYLLPKGKKEWPYEWCCRQWATFINRARKFKDDPRYLEVYYEDLVKNPKENLDKITGFLNLEKIPQKNIEKAHKKFNFKKMPTHKNVKKPIDKKKINKWLDKMLEKDKQIFKKIAGKELIKLGYEKNNNW